MLEYPVCHIISKSFERISNAFTTTNENFKKAYIFDNGKITLDVDTRETLSSNLFTNNYFMQFAPNIYRLWYCDFYDDNRDLISSETIAHNTGLVLTPVQIYRI
jgi:hypothetical protein